MLSFATTRVIDDRILEIKPFNGIEITAAMMVELENLMADESTPERVLINQENHYSFDFQAMLHARQLPHVQAMAIYAPDHAAQSAARVIHGDQGKSRYPYELFVSQEEAIAWLLAR